MTKEELTKLEDNMDGLFRSHEAAVLVGSPLAPDLRLQYVDSCIEFQNALEEFSNE